MSTLDRFCNAAEAAERAEYEASWEPEYRRRQAVLDAKRKFLPRFLSELNLNADVVMSDDGMSCTIEDIILSVDSDDGSYCRLVVRQVNGSIERGIGQDRLDEITFGRAILAVRGGSDNVPTEL